jgi:hypothetical protein
MKLRVHPLCPAAIPLAAILLCLALVSHAATKQTNAPVKTPSASPAPASTPVVTEIPRSIFVVPTSERQGRDPFFPHTTRLFAVAPTGNTNIVRTKQPSVAVELALKGISGTPDRPLAIINNQTFSVGEEGDVVTGARRMRIRCVEINVAAESVTIQIGNERRELRLKQGK